MYQCAYCKELNSTLPIYGHGEYYHVPCYVAKVHDDMVRIQAHIESIKNMMDIGLSFAQIKNYLDTLSGIVEKY